MATATKIEQDETLITLSDVVDLDQIFTLAIKGAGTDRKNLKQVLMYEDVLKIKMILTLKLIKAKAKK